MLVFSMYKISFKYKQMLWGGPLLTTFYLACKGKPNLHLDFVGGRRVIFKKFSRDWNLHKPVLVQVAVEVWLLQNNLFH